MWRCVSRSDDVMWKCGDVESEDVPMWRCADVAICARKNCDARGVRAVKVVRTSRRGLRVLGRISGGTPRALRGSMNRPEMEARTATFARDALELANAVRERPGGGTPANQLANCSSSAAANYRAAGRARSHKEFVSKLGLANEESDEAVFWLEHIGSTSLGLGLAIEGLQSEAKELRAIIARSYATARRRKG